MEKFDRERGCVKCGSETPATFEYHERGLAKRSCGEVDGEHMHRWCQECGYEWVEATLG